jgi:precorrin-6B methylase 2
MIASILFMLTVASVLRFGTGSSFALNASIGGSSLTSRGMEVVNKTACQIEMERILLTDSWKNVNLGDLQEVIKLLDVAAPMSLDGDMSEGHSGQTEMMTERMIYYSLASLSCVKTICEVGFNAGHSALLWLHANPKAEVIMFDIFTHNYSAKGEAFLRNYTALNAAERLVIHKGDSNSTLRSFHSAHPMKKCDVISVDGAHGYEDVIQDFRGMKKMADQQWHVGLVDDTPCPKAYCVDAPIKKLVSRGVIKLLKALPLAKNSRGVTVFQFQY